MYNERDIPGFNDLYVRYQDLYDNIDLTIKNKIDEYNHLDLADLDQRFNFFDIKLRMAFAIENISLNDQIMRRKYGDLKLCHLMLYKIADLWFAYDSFFKLHNTLGFTPIQSKIIWLNQETHLQFSNLMGITNALFRTNTQLKLHFNNSQKRKNLKNYLKYCRNNSEKSQKNRLNNFIDKINIETALPDFNESEILTVTYSIRNNFVHNGETTVTTPELNYYEKKDLVIVLYEFLTMVILSITIKTIENKINEYD